MPLDTQSLRATLIGPLYHFNIYFATRHPRSSISSINPFASLNTKFWINYALLYAIMMMVYIFINLVLFKKLVSTTDSNSILSEMVRSGLMLPCLMSFTFWTFNTLFGVDLASVLVGMNKRRNFLETCSSLSGIPE